MVDMSTYNVLHNKEATPPQDMTFKTQDITFKTQDELGNTAMEAVEPPGDDFLLTLPSQVSGFGFHNKRWGTCGWCSESR
jgi:hypothetical protein